MSNVATMTSVNGTIEDVAAFFRVSVRTVASWKEDGKLGYFQESRNVMFGADDVVAMKVKFYVATGGMKPGEAQERARSEWLDHMRVRSILDLGKLEKANVDLQRRVGELEKLLQPMFPGRQLAA